MSLFSLRYEFDIWNDLLKDDYDRTNKLFAKSFKKSEWTDLVKSHLPLDEKRLYT